MIRKMQILSNICDPVIDTAMMAKTGKYHSFKLNSKGQILKRNGMTLQWHYECIYRTNW